MDRQRAGRGRHLGLPGVDLAGGHQRGARPVHGGLRGARAARRDATGEAVFQRACLGCHGTPHQGEGRLVDFAPVLPEDALASHPIGKYTPAEQRQALAEKVRHGPFLGFGGIMPPFSTEVMTDAEIAGLLAFFGL
ncbi:MAG: cytochrome c [Polyangiaceae bacterium]